MITHSTECNKNYTQWLAAQARHNVMPHDLPDEFYDISMDEIESLAEAGHVAAESCPSCKQSVQNQIDAYEKKRREGK